MRPSRLLFPLLSVLLGLGPAAGSAPLETLEQVEDCIRANQPGLSIVQTYELESIDRIGSTRSSEGQIFWKKFEDGLSKALVRVTGPPDLRGTAALIIERDAGDPDIFSYAPEIGKVRRITKHTVRGSFMGSDFTYEDLERIQGLSEDGERSLEPPGELDGRPVYVLEATPGRGEDSEYSRVRSYVDQERCVTLRVECFDDKDRVAKTFTTPLEKILRIEERWIPHLVSVRDELDGTSTALRIEKVEIDVDVPKRHFTATALEKRR